MDLDDLVITEEVEALVQLLVEMGMDKDTIPVVLVLAQTDENFRILRERITPEMDDREIVDMAMELCPAEFE